MRARTVYIFFLYIQHYNMPDTNYVLNTRIICYRGFPGGAVVKNPSANAGNTGSSPGPGRSHMPRSN